MMETHYSADDSSIDHRMTMLEGLVEQLNLRLWSLQGSHKEMKERMDEIGVRLEMIVDQQVDKLAATVSKKTSGQDPQPFDWVDIVDKAMTEAQAKVCNESNDLPSEALHVPGALAECHAEQHVCKQEKLKKLGEEADSTETNVEGVSFSSQSNTQRSNDSRTSSKTFTDANLQGLETDALSQSRKSMAANAAPIIDEDASQIVEHLHTAVIKYLSSDFREHMAETIQSMQQQLPKQAPPRSHGQTRDGAASSPTTRQVQTGPARQPNRSGRASPRGSLQPQHAPDNVRRQNGSRRVSPRGTSREHGVETPQSMPSQHHHSTEYKCAFPRAPSQDFVIETGQSMQVQASSQPHGSHLSWPRDGTVGSPATSSRVTSQDSAREHVGSRGASPRVTPHVTPRSSHRKILHEKSSYPLANKSRQAWPLSATVPVSVPSPMVSSELEGLYSSQLTLTASGASLTAPDATALADVAVAVFENQRAGLEASGTPRNEVSRSSSPDQAINAKMNMSASGSQPILLKHVASSTCIPIQPNRNSMTGNFSASQLIAKLQPAYSSMNVQKGTG